MLSREQRKKNRKSPDARNEKRNEAQGVLELPGWLKEFQRTLSTGEAENWDKTEPSVKS